MLGIQKAASDHCVVSSAATVATLLLVADHLQGRDCQWECLHEVLGRLPSAHQPMPRPPMGGQTSLQKEQYVAQMSWLGAVVCTTASDWFLHRASWLCNMVINLQTCWSSMLRPYHPEQNPSRLIREVKLNWPQIVRG